MEDNSSYASYLPSVLWRPDPPDATPPGRVPLGPLLRIFEKVLTGAKHHEGLFATAADAVLTELKVEADFRASPEYRKLVLEIAMDQSRQFAARED